MPLLAIQLPTRHESNDWLSPSIHCVSIPKSRHKADIVGQLGISNPREQVHRNPRIDRSKNPLPNARDAMRFLKVSSLTTTVSASRKGLDLTQHRYRSRSRVVDQLYSNQSVGSSFFKERKRHGDASSAHRKPPFVLIYERHGTQSL